MGTEIIFEIEEPRTRFDKHLEIPFNDRIILSAPFGSGKTYFLKEYFKNHPEYEVVHLYPVNYSVASNEDIFELIKYDIFFELLSKDIDFDKVKFSELDYLPLFLQANSGKVLDAFTPLLLSIPRIGKSIYKIKENLQKLLTRYKKEIEDIQIDEQKSILDYLESFTEKRGSIYEEDFYTQLIYQYVNQLKQKGEEHPKETILIIDDLDRVDPDHLFRILNVLSAQMDRNGTDNKFDFDKIILVFDQWNVRNIFENRYGANVDYTGYIDKFYSHLIFDFENYEDVKNGIRELINSLEIFANNDDLNQREDYIDELSYLFKKLIDTRTLTIRKIIKTLKTDFKYENKRLEIKGIHGNIEKAQFNIFFSVKLLYNIYGNWEDLMDSLEKLKNLKLTENRCKSRSNILFAEAIFFLDIDKLKLNSINPSSYMLRNVGTVSYRVDYDRNNDKYVPRVYDLNKMNYDKALYHLIFEVFDKIKKEDLLSLA